jgi:hypothetical protein
MAIRVGINDFGRIGRLVFQGEPFVPFKWRERHSCGEGSSVCDRPGAQNTRVARSMADAAELVAYGFP